MAKLFGLQELYDAASMEKSLATLMDEILGRLQLFESLLTKRIDAMSLSRISKLPLKVLLYREALIWRIVELGRGAFESLSKDTVVTGIVLARAAVETSAALWYLCAKVAAVVESKAVGDIDHYLMKMVMGIATGDPKGTDTPSEVIMPRPVRVGEFVKQAEKDIPGFAHQYGVLSEYAHPNWAGTVLLYSANDQERRVTNFGRNIRGAQGTKHLGAKNLSGALAMFEISYNRITDLLPDFTAVCETSLKNQPDV